MEPFGLCSGHKRSQELSEGYHYALSQVIYTLNHSPCVLDHTSLFPFSISSRIDPSYKVYTTKCYKIGPPWTPTTRWVERWSDTIPRTVLRWNSNSVTRTSWGVDGSFFFFFSCSYFWRWKNESSAWSFRAVWDWTPPVPTVYIALCC